MATAAEKLQGLIEERQQRAKDYDFGDALTSTQSKIMGLGALIALAAGKSDIAAGVAGRGVLDAAASYDATKAKLREEVERAKILDIEQSRIEDAARKTRATTLLQSGDIDPATMSVEDVMTTFGVNESTANNIIETAAFKDDSAKRNAVAAMLLDNRDSWREDEVLPNMQKIAKLQDWPVDVQQDSDLLLRMARNGITIEDVFRMVPYSTESSTNEVMAYISESGGDLNQDDYVEMMGMLRRIKDPNEVRSDLLMVERETGLAMTAEFMRLGFMNPGKSDAELAAMMPPSYLKYYNDLNPANRPTMNMLDPKDMEIFDAAFDHAMENHAAYSSYAEELGTSDPVAIATHVASKAVASRINTRSVAQTLVKSQHMEASTKMFMDAAPAGVDPADFAATQAGMALAEFPESPYFGKVSATQYLRARAYAMRQGKIELDASVEEVLEMFPETEQPPTTDVPKTSRTKGTIAERAAAAKAAVAPAAKTTKIDQKEVSALRERLEKSPVEVEADARRNVRFADTPEAAEDVAITEIRKLLMVRLGKTPTKDQVNEEIDAIIASIGGDNMPDDPEKALQEIVGEAVRRARFRIEEAASVMDIERRVPSKL